MRTALRYGAAVGVMATAFSTFGMVSAFAGQTPGTSAPISAVQLKGSPDNQQGQQGQMAQQYHRYCHAWGYGHHHRRYCRSYY